MPGFFFRARGPYFVPLNDAKKDLRVLKKNPGKFSRYASDTFFRGTLHEGSGQVLGKKDPIPQILSGMTRVVSCGNFQFWQKRSNLPPPSHG